MKKSTTLGCLGIAMASLAATGCVGTPDEDVASAQEAVLTSNVLTSNVLTSNVLTSNVLTSNVLTSNVLTSNVLTSNVLTSNALKDPDARELLSHIVSCALTDDQSVTITVEGTTYTYQGAIGLAPEWGEANGRCDQTCQQWVSGCLIARLDYLGVEREISIRGASHALKTSHQERQAYPVYEATYYGNVFQSPQIIYGCLLPWQTSDERVCGPSLTSCAVHFTGDCFTNCDFPLADGAFPNCRDKPWWEPGATSYVGSVTVFLAPGEP